jgi:putative hydrolase of the HAD superfamily
MESITSTGNFHGVRAVIFDVYHTLLGVSRGPLDAEAGWVDIWAGFFQTPPPLTLAEFDGKCRQIIQVDHASRRLSGERWPEVDWPSVAAQAESALAGLQERLPAFLQAHARLQRTTWAMPGALAFLDHLQQRGLPLGIASNAQAYTFGELQDAGISPGRFPDEYCFWSFQHGFSKPDPRVFLQLITQLALRGIAPSEILMIGDRPDNDIAPARAAGWQAWHFQGKWPLI